MLGTGFVLGLAMLEIGLALVLQLGPPLASRWCLKLQLGLVKFSFWLELTLVRKLKWSRGVAQAQALPFMHDQTYH